MNNNAPCKDCKNRSSSCHSTCYNYLQFREECQKDYNKRALKSSAVPTDLKYRNKNNYGRK